MSSLWKYNPKMLFSGTYLVKPYGFYVYARSKTDDLYHAVPKREKDVHDIIINLLRDGDVFVDVGANIGYYTILASKIVGDRGKVISIEPISNTFKILKFNVFKLNELKNVKLIENAAWCEKDTIKFSLPTGYYGIASAVQNYKDEEVEVDTVTLDDLLQPFDTVRLMKIDVEGSEYEVLLGASKTLDRTDYVVMEISRRTEECLKFLKKQGFKCKKLKFTTCWLAAKDNKR
jgi:FkbM family methyltransferase